MRSSRTRSSCIPQSLLLLWSLCHILSGTSDRAQSCTYSFEAIVTTLAHHSVHHQVPSILVVLENPATPFYKNLRWTVPWWKLHHSWNPFINDWSPLCGCPSSLETCFTKIKNTQGCILVVLCHRITLKGHSDLRFNCPKHIPSPSKRLLWDYACFSHRFTHNFFLWESC